MLFTLFRFAAFVFFLDTFVFLRPLFLALVPLAVFIFVWFRKAAKVSSGDLNRFIDAELLPHLGLKNEPQKKSSALAWVLALLWLGGSVALAGPSFREEKVTLQKEQQPLMVVLDLSWSMQATDLTPTRIGFALF